ncbi:MAG TPA: DUF4382 domain-containing protein [Gemmatimonadales bacterium]|nr:DUF4382 domain-containing protein [Gemmatimonadales bacterium]
MSRGILSALAAAALLGGGACYQDDTIPAAPQSGKPLAKVLLTDAPFPYDSVASVNVYVVRIEANALADTSGGGAWVLIAEPGRSFNLLTLRQGTTAFVGEGEVSAGQYRALKMTIDTSLSSIRWKDGSKATVNWQNWSGSNEQPLYALVQYPLNVPTDGAEIVIDFDVGQSFLYDFFGTKDFLFMPRFRAVNSAATGTISGTVASDYTGAIGTVPNASVAVYVGDPNQPPSTWSLVATARTDSGGALAGYYKVAFLPAGTYIVRAEQPDNPLVGPAVARNVRVVAGDVTSPVLFLPRTAPGGGPFLRIWPRDNPSVGAGGSLFLRAAVADSNGDPVPDATVTWTSSDTAVATVRSGDSSSTGGPDPSGVVTGRRDGFATITATSGGLSDTLTVHIFPGELPPPGSAATVAVVPDNASLGVGDSVYFRAEVRDSAGNLLSDHPVSWFTTDSLVINVYPFGSQALVRPRAAGSVFLRATSDGKVGQAAITVH